MTTGEQAECYANNFINLHLESIAGGKTYAELGDVQTQLRAQIATAQKNNASNLADLQKQLADATTNRETVFKGETLRGLLLTSFGFSQFGDKAAQAATVAYIGAGVLPAGPVRPAARGADPEDHRLRRPRTGRPAPDRRRVTHTRTTPTLGAPATPGGGSAMVEQDRRGIACEEAAIGQARPPQPRRRRRPWSRHGHQ